MESQAMRFRRAGRIIFILSLAMAAIALATIFILQPYSDAALVAAYFAFAGILGTGLSGVFIAATWSFDRFSSRGNH